MGKDKIVIIGGGPAGMMAAITASEFGNKKVILLEKNTELGKKLKLAGGGRCNITNDKEPPDFLEHVISNHKFLLTSLWSFTSQDLMNFFESRGCKLKTEQHDHVFPTSENSMDIVQILANELENNSVEIRLQQEVKDIVVNNNGITGVQLANSDIIPTSIIILATGGISYPGTGSTGAGHALATKLGHKVTTLKPALVSMEVREKWLTNLTGISFENTVLTVEISNKNISVDGDLLFTHSGISGPAAHKLSSFLARTEIPREGMPISVDFFPHVSYDELEEQFILLNSSNKQISTVLSEFWPKKFVFQMLKQLKIDETTKMNKLTKRERTHVISNMKSFAINVMRLQSVKQATITSGGVGTKEVNPSTMESKLIDGLFFAGEILDVDALTGGYNLQIAFSTGYVAGMNCLT